MLIQIVRFVFLIGLQVVLLNHIQWSGYINPYIYILFILLLPIETPAILVMIIGLFTGLTIDMFGDSSGMHAAASVALCFARPSVLKLIAPRDGYESESNLSIQALGINWFITYVSILVVIHHSFYFYCEVFRFSEFFITLLKALLNSIVTILLIVLGQYLFGKEKK